MGGCKLRWWLCQSEYHYVRIEFRNSKPIKLSQTQERLWPSILQIFDLPDTYPMNAVPTPVAQLLGHYYKAILLPFEEWTRKNAHQQRPMVNAQGQVGQPQQVGQHGMGGQMS